MQRCALFTKNKMAANSLLILNPSTREKDFEAFAFKVDMIYKMRVHLVPFGLERPGMRRLLADESQPTSVNDKLSLY